MKCARFAFLLVLVSAMVGCGGGEETPAQESPASGINTRAVAVNNFPGLAGMRYIDYSSDRGTPSSLSVEAVDQFAVSANRTRAMAFSNNSRDLYTFSLKEEKLIAIYNLGQIAENIAIDPLGQLAFASVRNSTVSGSTPGEVFVMDLRIFDPANPFKARIAVPLVERVVPRPDALKLIAISTSLNTVTFIDAVTFAKTQVQGNFDHPVDAVFSPDLTRGYILNCGPECGGSEASVQEINPATGALGRKMVVDGASIAIWDNNKLYVAGNRGLANRVCGSTLCPAALTVIDPLAWTKLATVDIGPGLHREIAATGGKVLIGARECTNGCLSTYDVASGNVQINATPASELPRGPVTGITAVPNRDVVYVAEGGEMRIYDLATGQPLSDDQQLNFTGNIVDVEIVDLR